MWAARANRISAVMSISALVTAPNTCRRPPSSASSLNVAEADLKVAFAFFAAAVEGPTRGGSDCRGGGWRLIRRCIADLQRIAAQCLGALPGLDRQQVSQYLQPQRTRASVRTAGLAVGSTQGSAGSVMANYHRSRHKRCPDTETREAAASPDGTASPSGAAANPSCGMSRRMTGSPADDRVVVRSRGYDILLNAGVAVRMVDVGKMRIEAAEAVGVDRHFMGGWVAAVERSGEAALAGGRPGRRRDEPNTRPSTILMSSCTTTSSRRWLGDPNRTALKSGLHSYKIRGFFQAPTVRYAHDAVAGTWSSG
jgi:hypothetical protein